MVSYCDIIGSSSQISVLYDTYIGTMISSGEICFVVVCPTACQSVPYVPVRYTFPKFVSKIHAIETIFQTHESCKL